MTLSRRVILYFLLFWLNLPSALLVTASTANAQVVTFSGQHPFHLVVPTTYQKSKPAPLIIALHGYSSSGATTEKRFQLDPVAQAHGILLIYPDGTKDAVGNSFWNATPACCNVFKAGVDDEGYLISIIDAVSKKYAVDQKRIYILGHSNGGFMAHRMACDQSQRIAAIASYAGATFEDPGSCMPASPVSILQIHGTADKTILYHGGLLNGEKYPSALRTVESWAKLNLCSALPVKVKKKLDVEKSIIGAETKILRFQSCENQTNVELWSVDGGVHVPFPTSSFAIALVDFFLSHPKK